MNEKIFELLQEASEELEKLLEEAAQANGMNFELSALAVVYSFVADDGRMLIGRITPEEFHHDLPEVMAHVAQLEHENDISKRARLN